VSWVNSVLRQLLPYDPNKAVIKIWLLEAAKSYGRFSCLKPGLDWTRLFISLTAGAGTRCMSLLRDSPTLSQADTKNLTSSSKFSGSCVLT